jgi:hypothetical protein
MKPNPSDTDFRKSEWPDVDPGCLGCPEKVTHRIVEEYRTVTAIKDGYPVSDRGYPEAPAPLRMDMPMIRWPL